MGFLRLFLSVTVANGHYPAFTSVFLIHGFCAVLCFFIISGFYMALILDYKYEKFVFYYLNRALRIYPVPTLLLITYAILSSLGLTFLHIPKWHILGWANQILIFPSILWGNITLTMDNNIFFGQLYTVGLEIMFYMIAPFLMRLSTRWLACLAVVSGLVHIALHAAGLPARPWQYEFFPGILVFFLSGALSYRAYKRLSLFAFNRHLGYMSIFPILFICAFVSAATRASETEDFVNTWQTALLFLTIAAAMPFLFGATKNSRLDRFLGDLSYPLYACHFPVGFAIGSASKGAVFFTSFAISILLVLCIERPLERVRNRVSTWADRPRSLGSHASACLPN